MKKDITPYATTEDVAKLLQVCVRTVHNMVLRKEIPYFKVGRAYRFDLQKVQKKIENA